MRVTTKGRYALRAMVNMALKESDKPVSIKSICEEEDLSPIFLEQIFTRLKQFGLVRSVRGAGGGFILAKDSDEITVMDILLAVEEGPELTPCCRPETDGTPGCDPKNLCQSKKFWQFANNHFKEFFEGFTLAGIVKDFN